MVQDSNSSVGQVARKKADQITEVSCSVTPGANVCITCHAHPLECVCAHVFVQERERLIVLNQWSSTR